jgi:formylglycine-generating enzyme required for sulfatase activity
VRKLLITIGMLAAVFSWRTSASAQAQSAADHPRTAPVDYPHVKLGADGIAAPVCNDVSKLLVGGILVCSPQEMQTWLDEMRGWRANRRIRMGYSDEIYNSPSLQWTQSSFIQPQMMMEDRYFYDAATGKYTVDRYLDDTEKRYGGIDSVLIWHTYTNIGIDDRNQYDLLRDMPGGIRAVKQMIADFHHRGVKVLFPVMVWDQGTHDEAKPNWVATAELMKEIGADGVNGDTMDGIPQAFDEAAKQVDHRLVLEPEHFPGHDEMLAWNSMSWGYLYYPYAPEIVRSKWLEPRHMVHVCARWNREKTDNLQAAFFNGVGYESWENVWGIWNGVTPHDGEAIRRIATIERGVAPFLVSADWQPYYTTEMRGLFASYFPLKGDAVWTLINRDDFAMEGELLRVKNAPAGARFFDVYHGVELTPRMDGKDALLTFTVEPQGYGAILQLTSAPSKEQQALFVKMHAMTEKPLSNFSTVWKFLPQTMVTIEPTKATSKAPVGMTKIPAASFKFHVSGIEIEGRDSVGVDVQYPWEPSPRRYHDHTLNIDALWMDINLVTNQQFKQFMDAAHYSPADAHNFLRDWKNGSYPEGWAEKPVTWVSLEDARAYAKWAHKRLPHEWEWQYAAQGLDGRKYPWGNSWNVDAVPTPDKDRTLTSPAAVGTHPLGDSPFGIHDMVGNVWQWTDEYQDEHTRAAVLRGGSYYQPSGSVWYFPQAYRNDEHNKLLLMAPSEDRSGAIGFRCVMDAQ